MQSQVAAPQGAGHYPNPYLVYGAPSGFAPLTDEAGVYLPTGPGDAQRMELLNMPGDGSDVWLDARAVQLYLQISLTTIYKLVHAGEIPAVKLGTKTIRVNRRALEEYLQRAQQMVPKAAVPRCKGAPRRGSENDSTSKGGASTSKPARRCKGAQ